MFWSIIFQQNYLRTFKPVAHVATFRLATWKDAPELQRKEEGENWGVKLKLLRKWLKIATK